MSLSSNTVMPSATFRHISVMVFFMAVLMGFCAFGLISVTSIISGWTHDIADTITIEIPAFDVKSKTILNDTDIQSKTQSIINLVSADPAIVDVESFRPDEETVIDDRFNIPTPVFLTLNLHKNRADNTEHRITETILKSVPTAIVKTPTQWIQNIQITATTLYFVFMGLMTCVLIVTGFVVAGVVRTQLVASKETITLIHLCGASASKITNLFQSIIVKTMLKGCVPALFIMAAIVSPLAAFMDFDGSLILYWLSLPIVIVMFLCLSAIVTFITVSGALRNMP